MFPSVPTVQTPYERRKGFVRTPTHKLIICTFFLLALSTSVNVRHGRHRPLISSFLLRLLTSHDPLPSLRQQPVRRHIHKLVRPKLPLLQSKQQAPVAHIAVRVQVDHHGPRLGHVRLLKGRVHPARCKWERTSEINRVVKHTHFQILSFKRAEPAMLEELPYARPDRVRICGVRGGLGFGHGIHVVNL